MGPVPGGPLVARSPTKSVSGLPEVAVVIPTVDRSESLARCIDAVLAGIHAAAQVIVVDQGGNPLTRDVVETRKRRGHALVHIALVRRGASVARNAGVIRSANPIVAFTDDDCVPDPGWLQEVVAAFERPPRPAAVTGRVLPLGRPAAGLHPVASRTSQRPRDHRRTLRPWDVGTGGNLAVRREWLDRVAGWDERLGPGTPGRAAEDIDIIERLLRAGATIRYAPTALVFHERQPTRSWRASRSRYGYGIGAATAMWLRDRDVVAIPIFVRWVASRMRLLGGAIARANWSRARDEGRMVMGAFTGAMAGVLGVANRPSASSPSELEVAPRPPRDGT
jgi:GT2 family glycosyltransferase